MFYKIKQTNKQNVCAYSCYLYNNNNNNNNKDKIFEYDLNNVNMMISVS